VARPRGDIRQALAQAAQALHVERGAFTWREVAQAAQVGYTAARQTVKNMQQAGELVRCGRRKVPGVCRPVNLYAMPTVDAAPSTARVEDVLRAWLG